MARLPQPGGDSGNWGTILNDYLSQAHKADGTIKDNAVTANTLAPNSVTNAALALGSVTNSTIAQNGVAKTNLASDVQGSLDKADSALQDAPVNSVNAMTGAVVIVKNDIGLGNVDNTSDTNKPVSTAVQTALYEKLSQSSFRTQVPYGNVAQRVFGGRMGLYNNATATTFHVACELQSHFDAVQIIFGSNSAAYSDNIAIAKVAVLPNATDLNGSTATWTTVTKSKLLRIGYKTSLSASRIAYTTSDIIPISSVARNDGGTKPIIAVRAYMSQNAALPVMGNGTDNFTNWATRTDGHLMAIRAQAVDGVTTPSNFTSTTNISQTPIIGIRYWSRGRVVNVAAVGDSITDGRGTYLGDGFGNMIVDQLSSNALTVEYSNFGWSGQSTANYGERAIDILQSELLPDIMIIPSSSPNNGDPLTPAAFLTSAATRARIIDECYKKGVVPILWTMIPCDPSIHDWNATDNLRIADNQAVMSLNARGIIAVDTAPLLSGTVDSDGQMGINAAYYADGIHPNTAGYQQMASVIIPAVRLAGGIS